MAGLELVINPITSILSVHLHERQNNYTAETDSIRTDIGRLEVPEHPDVVVNFELVITT